MGATMHFHIAATTEKQFAKATLFDKKIQKEIVVVVVYGAAQDDGKHDFLVSLANICSSLSIPSIIGGDFNIIRYAHEKNKKGGITKFSDILNSIIHSSALREIFFSADSSPGPIIKKTQPWKSWAEF